MLLRSRPDTVPSLLLRRVGARSKNFVVAAKCNCLSLLGLNKDCLVGPRLNGNTRLRSTVATFPSWRGFYFAVVPRRDPTKQSLGLERSFIIFNGEGEIRTRDTVSRTHAFQACGFNHSPTSPVSLGKSEEHSTYILAKCPNNFSAKLADGGRGTRTPKRFPAPVFETGALPLDYPSLKPKAHLLARKNSCITARHSSSSTPLVTLSRWFKLVLLHS